ncbi:MAG: guanylate kinase [Bacteroidota bacterium]
MNGKLLIFSAPSGSGKTSIVKALQKKIPSLEFSISVTSRKPRKGEVNGKDYYFVSPEEFRKKIRNEEFIEWEEVYKDTFYGTLKSELQRIWDLGKHVIFDVDVIGGLNLKSKFPTLSLAVFVTVPDYSELEKRLRKRSTESEEAIQKRLARAKEEMSYADRFDAKLLNDDLEKSILEAERLVIEFIAG